MLELWTYALVFVFWLFVIVVVGGALALVFIPIGLGIRNMFRDLNAIKNPALRIVVWVLTVIFLFALWPLAPIYFWCYND